MRHIEIDAGYLTPCHMPTKKDGVPRKVNPDGYIQKKDGGRYVQAHKLAYEQERGEVRNFLDHLCRNRWCCNAWHLEDVETRINNRRGDATKLSADDIGRMKLMRAAGEKIKDIAKQFGISQGHASNVINGKYWCDGPCAAWEEVKSKRSGKHEEL